MIYVDGVTGQEKEVMMVALAPAVEERGRLKMTAKQLDAIKQAQLDVWTQRHD